MGIGARPQIGCALLTGTRWLAVLFAAGASLVTPLGYQTNLMVYGPGGYRFTDFVKVGLPLSLILITVALTLIPQLWPF